MTSRQAEQDLTQVKVCQGHSYTSAFLPSVYGCNGFPQFNLIVSWQVTQVHFDGASKARPPSPQIPSLLLLQLTVNERRSYSQLEKSRESWAEGGQTFPVPRFPRPRAEGKMGVPFELQVTPMAKVHRNISILM